MDHQALLVEEWNRIYPPGTQVRVRLDDGRYITTRTRSIAWQLGHGRAVVNLESTPEKSFSGGYDLGRLIPWPD